MLGVERHATEPAATFAKRVASLHPQHAHEILDITRRFELIAYQEIRSPVIYADLERKVKAFKPVKPVAK